MKFQASGVLSKPEEAGKIMAQFLWKAFFSTYLLAPGRVYVCVRQKASHSACRRLSVLFASVLGGGRTR